MGNVLRPGIVHRIDKETSGLVVIAKNNLSHTNLSKQFFDHSITRVYQCLVWGKLRPRFGRIETFITRSSKNRQMMEVSISKGKNRRSSEDIPSIDRPSVEDLSSIHPPNIDRPFIKDLSGIHPMKIDRNCIEDLSDINLTKTYRKSV